MPKELYTNPRYKTTTNNGAKMLYALLLDRMELSRTNGWIEDDGTIFLIFKREDLADMLDICATTVWRAIKQLKEVGLIEEKRQGLNRPNLIYIGKINYSVLEEKEPESIEKEITSSSSAPSTSILSSDIENLKDRTFTAERSGDLKNKCQDISKLKPNKTDNNKPEYNNTDTASFTASTNAFNVPSASFFERLAFSAIIATNSDLFIVTPPRRIRLFCILSQIFFDNTY